MRIVVVASAPDAVAVNAIAASDATTMATSARAAVVVLSMCFLLEDVADAASRRAKHVSLP